MRAQAWKEARLICEEMIYMFGDVHVVRGQRERSREAESRCGGVKNGEEGQWPSRYCFWRCSLFPPRTHGALYVHGGICEIDLKREMPNRDIAISPQRACVVLREEFHLSRSNWSECDNVVRHAKLESIQHRIWHSNNFFPKKLQNNCSSKISSIFVQHLFE